MNARIVFVGGVLMLFGGSAFELVGELNGLLLQLIGAAAAVLAGLKMLAVKE